MPFIPLAIEQPCTGQAYAYSGEPPSVPPSVDFIGSAPTGVPAGVPLYFRWYSSLNIDIDTDASRFSMNRSALTAPTQAYRNGALALGSHVITFAVSDRPTEAPADLQVARYGGVSGGARGLSACVIHVYKANIVGLKPTESRRDLTLKAEAPWAWDDPEYQKHNCIGYHWTFEPSDGPLGRPTWETPDPPSLSFSKATHDEPIPLLTCVADLPAAAEGAYRVTLTVMHRDRTGIKSEDHRTITLTA